MIFTNCDMKEPSNVGKATINCLKSGSLLIVLKEMTAKISAEAATTMIASPAKIRICVKIGRAGICCLKIVCIPSMTELNNLLAIQIMASPSTISKLVTVFTERIESTSGCRSNVFEKMFVEYRKVVTVSGEACRKRISMTRIIMTTGTKEKRNPNAHAEAYAMRSFER